MWQFECVARHPLIIENEAQQMLVDELKMFSC